MSKPRASTGRAEPLDEAAIDEYEFPEPLEFVEVEWLDSVSLTYGWNSPEFYRKVARAEGGMEHRTAGYLIEESDERVVIGLSTSDARGNVCQAMTIPRGAVTNIERIR